MPKRVPWLRAPHVRPRTPSSRSSLPLAGIEPPFASAAQASVTNAGVGGDYRPWVVRRILLFSAVVVMAGVLAACGASNRSRIESAASDYDSTGVTGCESIGSIGSGGRETWRCHFRDKLAYCFTLGRNDSTGRDVAEVLFRDPECPSVQ
jgi:hypothetical protein